MTRGERLQVREVELREGEELQRQREKLARIILDEMFQFVALLDTRGTLLEVNRAALEGGGMSLESIRGKPFWEAHWWTISAATQAQLQQAIQRAAAGEFVRYDVDVYGSARGNETITIDFSLLPVRDVNGRVVFLLPEGRNISEKKRAEAEVARKNRELRELLERVRELDELKSQFFANVSHELRTPLALILGPAERLLEEGSGLNETQRRQVEVVQRNAAMLLKHVSDLLDMSKLDAGKLVLRYREVDVAAALRLLASHFEGLAAARGITLSVAAMGSLRAEVDDEAVARMVFNLLSNAFKFTPDGGHIRLALEERPGRRMTLTVRDTGPGVRAELRERIFERFRQGDGSATRAQGGTGLGLAIVKELAELHHGTVSVCDAPGGGALFQIELPQKAPEGVPVGRDAGGEFAREEQGKSDAVGRPPAGVIEELMPSSLSGRASAPTVAPLAAAGTKEQGLKARVLVVEDNPDMRHFVVECLESDYQVESAADGQQGLEAILAAPPDLVVTDLMMPRLSGDQLVAVVRARDELAGLPVLVLSAKADEPMRVKLLREGVQDFVVKPFSAEELRARAANLVKLKRAREQLQGALSSRDQDVEILARQLALRTQQLEASLSAAQVATQRAERASQVRTDFLNLVSHELRTPLTALQLQVERLRRETYPALSARQQSMVAKMELASGRLLELVEVLLEQTRLESGRLRIDARSLALDVFVADVMDELRPRAERKGLALSWAAPVGQVVRADARLLRIILVNLVDNAIKYTDTGRVDVSLRREDGGIRLEVTDTGRGIAPEHLARIFEPFEQLETLGQKHTPGVGLGLALVRQIATALGGEVSVRSVLGRGSAFVASLPALPEPDLAPELVAVEPRADSGARSGPPTS